MKTKNIFIIGLIALATLSACSKHENHRGSGSVVTEVRSVPGFDAIELTHSAEVTVYQDSLFFVEVLDYQNIVGYIETKVVGNKLVIGLERHVQLRNSKAQVIIHMPKLVSLEIRGSGNIETIGRFDEFKRAEISGSGGIIAHEIHSTDLINLRISGSGYIRANGSCSILDANISGSGSLHLFNLMADTVYADITGAGDLEISATDLIDASISGSGSIVYQGTPKVRSSITGSGSIRHK